MADATRRDALLKIIADLDQQMRDAATMTVGLKEGSPDYGAAGQWLAEAAAEQALASKLLAEITGEECDRVPDA